MKALTLEHLDSGIQQLPALSLTVLEALATIDRGDSDFAALERIIAQDPALAARVLRVANSPFYGFSAHIGSVHDACVVLGIYTVRNIVLAAGVLDRFPPTAGGAFDRVAFWQHAVGVGAAARALARRLRQDAELAFTAGLLHDLGKLVLDAHFPDAFAAVLTERDRAHCLLRAAEEKTLGFDHTAVGARVAKHWRLPEPIVEAIARHHAPGQGPAAPVVDLVHIADIVCRGLEIGDGGDALIPVLAGDSLRRLGLSLDALKDCLPEVEEGVATGSPLLACG